jgi:hypothetical protein
MRVTFLALAAIIISVSSGWLAAGHAAAPLNLGTSDVAYLPIADGCGYGRHWVGGYTTITGSVMAGRCKTDP